MKGPGTFFTGHFTHAPQNRGWNFRIEHHAVKLLQINMYTASLRSQQKHDPFVNEIIPKTRALANPFPKKTGSRKFLFII